MLGEGDLQRESEDRRLRSDRRVVAAGMMGIWGNNMLYCSRAFIRHVILPKPHRDPEFILPPSLITTPLLPLPVLLATVSKQSCALPSSQPRISSSTALLLSLVFGRAYHPGSCLPNPSLPLSTDLGLCLS